MKKILVIGANGQLGNCIRKIAPDFESNYEFVFTDSQTLDITDENQVNTVFYDHKPDFCINASAYTAVDLAEKEKEKASTYTPATLLTTLLSPFTFSSTPSPPPPPEPYYTPTETPLFKTNRSRERHRCFWFGNGQPGSLSTPAGPAQSSCPKETISALATLPEPHKFYLLTCQGRIDRLFA